MFHSTHKFADYKTLSNLRFTQKLIMYSYLKLLIQRLPALTRWLHPKFWDLLERKESIQIFNCYRGTPNSMITRHCKYVKNSDTWMHNLYIGCFWYKKIEASVVTLQTPLCIFLREEFASSSCVLGIKSSKAKALAYSVFLVGNTFSRLSLLFKHKFYPKPQNRETQSTGNK